MPTTRHRGRLRIARPLNLTIILATSLLVVAACGSQASPGATSPASSRPIPSSVANDVGRYFSIEEVGLGPDGWVALQNYTESAASLDTLFLCQPPTCVDLPDVVVGPGELARIAAGDGSGLESVAMRDADLQLTPLDGEIALYSTDDVRDASRLWGYLEWGATPHTGTATAIRAGLWHEGSFAPSASHATRLWKTEDGLWVWDPGS